MIVDTTENQKDRDEMTEGQLEAIVEVGLAICALRTPWYEGECFFAKWALTYEALL